MLEISESRRIDRDPEACFFAEKAAAIGIGATIDPRRFVRNYSEIFVRFL